MPECARATEETPAERPPPMPERVARRRRYVMCRPEHFDVTYAINPWMNTGKPVDTPLAVAQWERLRTVLRESGHHVTLIDPVPGLPDMVYAANGALVIDGKVLGARFRHAERAAEGDAYLRWFRRQGFLAAESRNINEGEGDFLLTGTYVLGAHGFRSETGSLQEVQEYFGRPVIGLELVDPDYYHLDTALAVLDHDEVMYYPEAFSPGSREVLRRLFPGAIEADAADAQVFGLNAVSDGHRVFLPEAAAGLAARLRTRGFEPVGVDLSELLKGGGSVKCCTLEVRTER
ncbi:dimethylargininase [Streptomyces sp. NPDC048514]|uniref:dimethylargininase n=1 Tax=Streptomyces sp. NPDC048514 TaxID=3365564 RepID=UPI0037176E34